MAKIPNNVRCKLSSQNKPNIHLNHCLQNPIPYNVQHKVSSQTNQNANLNHGIQGQVRS